MRHGQRLPIGVLVAAALAVAVILVVPTGQGSWAADGILYVDAGATGGNDGSTWADAFTALQPALDAAGAGDQIWVAAGTYKPSLEFWPGDPRSASFQMKNGVALYGGFDPSAGAVAFEDRDWVSHATILSGDRNGDDGPDFANNGENSYHVFYHPAGLNLDGSAILDGFTVSGGNANGANPNNNGGGMFNDASSPALANCVFAGNWADYSGGGIDNLGSSSPTLTDCAFVANEANSGGGLANWHSSPILTNDTFSGNSALIGAGMANYDSSSPVLINCTFAGNSADFGQGGGMHNVGSSPTLTGCTFEDNSANDGGGMSNSNSSPTLTDCTFTGNSASSGQGGGMFNYDSSTSLSNCTLKGNQANYGGGICNNWNSSLTLTNCTLVENSATAGGGGMINWYSSPSLTNCTLWGNLATDGGGMFNYLSSPALTNSIVWGDTTGQIYNYDADSVPVVTYSDVQGSYPGEGNIAADPLFVDPANGDLHLGPGSPCIDAGNNAAPNLPATDFEGDARLIDGNGDGTATVDMGVDEAPEGSGPPPPPAMIYVDQDATGANDGTSWQNAFTDLQDALAWAVSGVQVWVAEGTYKPTSGDDRGASFQMKNGVALYGGFDPSVDATEMEDRDWVSHVTILSGDLHGDDGPDFANNGENSYHVFYHPAGLNLDGSAILDGFTVSGGNANARNHNYGGGVFNDGSSPALANCTFAGNWAEEGGGMANWNASPTLTHCAFAGNRASGSGGGMHNDLSASPTLTGCVFEGNLAGINGGGMYNQVASATLTNCTFRGNSARLSGGGGIANIASQLTLANVTFWGNSAGGNGGGMFTETNEPLWVRLTNCTFAGNSAVLGGAMYNNYSSPTLTNCLLWGNTRDQIVNCQSTPAVTYSDVQGGYPGEGNIALKPLFLDIDAGDLHLRPDSPCIDAGSNDAPNLPDLDFEGDARVLDGNGDGTATVDMGADEAPAAGPVPVEVEIDVKPGTIYNTINLTTPGLLPVAILTTGAFDAGTVNPESVRFAGAAPRRWASKDADGDGDLDLVLHFDKRDLQLDESDTEATLTGVTWDGRPIYGTDSVTVIGHNTSPLMVPLP